jgi:hypothetical protein
MISFVMSNIKSEMKNYLSKATDENFSIARLVCCDKTVQMKKETRLDKIIKE